MGRSVYDRGMKTTSTSSSAKIQIIMISVVVSVLAAVATSYFVFERLNQGYQELMGREVATPSFVAPKASGESAGEVAAPSRPVPQSLIALNERLVEISEAVKPSIVTVFTEKIYRIRRSPFGGNPFFNDPFFQQFFRGFGAPGGRPDQAEPFEERRQQGIGSGVIVSADGYILTNNHVIAEADEISVRGLDNSTFEAKVVGKDPKTDIAVIKIEAKGLRPVAQGNSDAVRVGEIVLALGSPMSANLAHTVTQGIVSAKGRSNVGLADYEDFIQTDASINPGNSGGALVNLEGELIGINTAIVTRSGGSQGIGFAVPVNMARAVMESLIKTGEVVRSYLGVQAQDLTKELKAAMELKEIEGVLVAAIQANSPAEKAGLQAGDIILKMENEILETATELRNKIAVTPPGTKVNFSILRDGDSLTIAATLERMPSEEAPKGLDPGKAQEQIEKLGFQVAALTPALREQARLSKDVTGVLVTEVDQSSAAFGAGIRQGDVIQSFNRRPIQTLDDFQAVAKMVKRGQTILLRVQKPSGRMFIAFTLRG